MLLEEDVSAFQVIDRKLKSAQIIKTCKQLVLQRYNS